VGLTKYLKKAFTYHWNMLLFGGGMAVAAVDAYFGGSAWQVVAPLVLAGEVAYLGFLGTHPKFQSYVEAQEAKEERETKTEDSQASLRRMLAALPAKTVQRFEALRGRCVELRQIASAIRDPQRVEEPPPLDEMQVSGLDRLLWIYLRLLFTQHSLDRFLRQTSEQQMQQDVDNLDRRIKGMGATDDPQKQRMRKSLEDNLETSRARLANYRKARDNGDLVKLEIERLENKIQSLSELAINRQEPDFISAQVDQVAASMVQTERTMNDLQFATGIPIEEAVPRIVQRQTVPAR
jgi:chemotaxis protein histidine kinase CheA